MSHVYVSKLKPGDRLSDNVMTKRGNLLLEKGRPISARDLQILRAFFIDSVCIESKQGAQPQEQTQRAAEQEQSILPLHQEFERMFSLLKRVFGSVRRGNQSIPILDLRQQLEALVKQIHNYNLLTFVGKQYAVQEHSIFTSILTGLTSYQLAHWLNLPQKDWMQIALGGLLHDIGNAKVDEAIFEKKTALNAEEREEVKRHTVNGYQILRNVPAINEGVKLSALQHHEREDGSGYPLSVKGDRIHQYAKIIAVADIFHAMTSNRSYKRATSPYLVLEQIQNESFGKLEPSIVQVFISRVTSFHNGTVVKLSDGRLGDIVFSERANPTRPWVNVGGVIVNLTVERHLYIEEVLQLG